MSTPRFIKYDSDPVTVAKRLLGQRLVRMYNGQRLAGTIVEVEAYLGAEDRAAHTFGGRRTARNESMYLSGGHAYVYFTYGMHFCLNVVCGRRDEGVAVLLRAIEPTEGLKMMFNHRTKAQRAEDLCSGPGKLTQALAVDRDLDAHNLRSGRILFIERLRDRMLPAQSIAITPRIGMGTVPPFWAEKPLRFCISESTFLSRKIALKPRKSSK